MSGERAFARDVSELRGKAELYRRLAANLMDRRSAAVAESLSLELEAEARMLESLAKPGPEPAQQAS